MFRGLGVWGSGFWGLGFTTFLGFLMMLSLYKSIKMQVLQCPTFLGVSYYDFHL